MISILYGVRSNSCRVKQKNFVNVWSLKKRKQRLWKEANTALDAWEFSPNTNCLNAVDASFYTVAVSVKSPIGRSTKRTAKSFDHEEISKKKRKNGTSMKDENTHTNTFIISNKIRIITKESVNTNARPLLLIYIYIYLYRTTISIL